MDEDNKKDKKSYEVSYLVKDESDASEITRILKQHEAEIIEEVSPKRITLAYKINKEAAAFFGYIVFSAGPENIPELNKNLETSKTIVRFLLITPPFTKQDITASTRPRRPTVEKSTSTRATNLPLSNEALEKKIEEILQ